MDYGKLDLTIQTNRAIKGEKVTPPLLVGENIEAKPPSCFKTPSYKLQLMRNKHVLIS